MTKNEPQESCVTNAKSFWSDFYAAPCFWLKVVSLTVILGLALFGLYKIVTSAFHYFNEPLSYFDSERLGQLGDFLGGTLNPIFGFATVCLLLWSVFIQRKELALTRDELKKSATALDKQYNLAKNEYNRKQLEALLEKNLVKYNDLLDKKFSQKICTVEKRIKPDADYLYTSIKQLQIILEQNFTTNDQVKKFGETQHDELSKLHDETYHQCKILLSLYKEISNLTNIESIKIDYRKTSTETYEKLKLVNPLVPETPPTT